MTVRCIVSHRSETTWTRLWRWLTRRWWSAPPADSWTRVTTPADASAEEVAAAFTQTDYVLPADRLDVLIVSPAATANTDWQPWASDIAAAVRRNRSDGTLILVPVIGEGAGPAISEVVTAAFDLTVRIGPSQYNDLDRVLWALDTARGALHRLPSVVDFNTWSVVPTSDVSQYDIVADLEARQFQAPSSGIESEPGKPVGAVVDVPDAYRSAVYNAFNDCAVLCVTSDSTRRIVISTMN